MSQQVLPLMQGILRGGDMVRSFGAADRNARARTLQEQQIQMAQDAADRENRVRAAQVAQNIAMETGYSLDGWGIDTEKLERDAARVAAGEDVPEFHAFSSGMANFEVENPGFSFKKAVPGPGGTITMAGSYDSGPKKGEVAPLTVNGTDASDDEVAYSDPRQAAALLINNYDSVMNDPALAEQKGRILRTKKLGTLTGELTSIKGQLTAGVIQKLRSLNAEPKHVRAVKAQLAQLSTPQEQIAYLRDNVIPAMQEDLDAFLSKEQQQVVQQASNMTRADGSKKSAQGYLGPVKNNVTGGTMTEVSIGVKIDGKEMEIPAMVPGLTQEEIDILANMELEGNAASIPASIKKKAEAHARKRIAEGKDPFYQDGETETKQVSPQEKAAEIKKLESRLANLEGKSGRGMADRRQGLRDQIAALKETPEEATAPKRTGQMARNNKPVPAPVQDLITEAAQVSQEELEQGRGPTFTQKQLSAFEEYLSSKGINSMAEAYKGTQEEIQALRAVLSQSLGDEAQRRRMFNEFNNVLQTGSPAYDQKTLAEAQQERRKIENTEFSNQTARDRSILQRDELTRQIAGDVDGTIGEGNKAIANVLFNENGSPKGYDMEDVDPAFDMAISSLWRGLKEADARVKKNPNDQPASQRADMLRREIFSKLSLYMQVYNRSDEPEVSILATESGAPFSSSDSTMSRIGVAERDGKGRPVKFILLKPDDKKQDGDAITASQLRKKLGSNELYKFFVDNLEIFIANRKS